MGQNSVALFCSGMTSMFTAFTENQVIRISVQVTKDLLHISGKMWIFSGALFLTVLYLRATGFFSFSFLSLRVFSRK